MRLFCFIAVLLTTVAPAVADSVPDIPVRAFFYASGKTQIEIEIDPRCFLENPGEEPYLYSDLQQRDDVEKQEMIDQALDLVSERLELVFDPPKGVKYPKYQVEFTLPGGKSLENPDDPVVMQLSWETFLPDTAKTYQIKTKEVGSFNVIPQNHINNEAIEPVQVLAPGEDSAILNLPDPLDQEEVRSLLLKPLFFGIGIFVVFLFLRSFRRNS